MFLNILAIKVFVRARWDLTKRGLYSLSNGTKRTLSRLRDQLTITVYWTPDQPAPANDDERLNHGVAAGSEDLLLRPVDEAPESLCSSCGLAPLPPGAIAPQAVT